MLNDRMRGRGERGLSIVELLVGVALGLFLVAGAVSLFVSNLGNSRRLLVEARINQDLRAASDLISRDLRRAGYWGNAISGTVIVAPATQPASNPYATVTPNAGASTIAYNFSRDVAENDALDNNEQFGFRLNAGGIDMRTDGNTWQTVTDPSVLTVTALTITPTETVVDIRESCALTCVGAGCPTITVRNYNLVLTGQAAADSAVVRTLRTRVRVRNDLLAGVCT